MLNTMPDAVEALRRGDVDAVFDDDVMLRQYSGDALATHAASGLEQYFAVAMALGSRTLLNIVDRAIRELRREHPEIPNAFNRKTIAHIGREEEAEADSKRSRAARWTARSRASAGAACCASASIPACRVCARGVTEPEAHGLRGLEPEIARRVAQLIFGDPNRVEFVPVQGEQRLSATRSTWLHAFFALRKSFAIFSTLLGTNWWNLGMAGKLPEFLCPRECVGTLDYVGLDYYWGVPSFWPRELHRLSAASDFQYANAPVWPDALEMTLLEAARRFPASRSSSSRTAASSEPPASGAPTT